MSKKFTIITICSFVLALGAGTLLGMGLAHNVGNPRGPGGRPTLETELGLTPAQIKDMQTLQKNIRDKYYGEPREQFRKLFEDRNNDIKKILTNDQLKLFETIDKDFRNKMDTLRDNMIKQREIGEKEEENQIKALLSDTQKAKYEEYLNKRKEHRHGPQTAPNSPPPATNNGTPGPKPLDEGNGGFPTHR